MILLRTISNFLGIVFFFLVVTACEDWLSVSPSSEVRYDDLFSHKNGFKDQLTGIYTAMCTESLYGANLTYGMVDVLGQQYVWTLETGNYYHLNRFEYTNKTSISVIDNTWNKMYNAIVNTNILLKGIREFTGVLSADESQIYEGEALGLRAFLHFYILRLFGKSYTTGPDTKAIPYVTEVSNKVIPLSTVSEVLNSIVADLEKAKRLLKNDPVKVGGLVTPFLGNRNFHFNYYAVCAALARVYLYKNDRENALTNALEVINANKYPWVKQENVTTPTREARDGIFLTESIFMLNNTDLDNLTGKYLREGFTSDKSNLLTMSQEVIDQIFEKEKYGSFDWRLNYYFEVQKETFYGSSKLWQFRTMPAAYRNQQPLIRISEMYLIAAECAASRTEAISYFNTLRHHRGFDAGSDLSEIISEEILRNEIGKEYRKEFIGEGQWFFYCKRINRKELPNAIVPFNENYYVLPLPDQEIEYGNRFQKTAK